MFQKLVSRNDDIKRLVDKGYAVGFDSGYLIVRDIPYLNEKLELKVGAIVSKLIFIDQERVAQDDHQIFFAGSHPYNIDGTPVANFGGGTVSLSLGPDAQDVVVERQFSNKPRVNGQLVAFTNFFDKIESYVGLISGPASAKYGATPLTYRYCEKLVEDSVFKIHDTLTSRAQITELSLKFRNEIVAIIGLGGTGAYTLDFLTKTPVKEIRGFDADPFHVHNAFRSPGRLDYAEFNRAKATIYSERYENLRHGLNLRAKFIDKSCEDDLAGVTFAFVCVDKGSARAEIFDLLISMNIPFIDVGMGLNRNHGALGGLLRTTYYSAENAVQIRDKGFATLTENANDEYKINIQISELNALNAALAVIKYKKLKGFYLERDEAFSFLFDLNDATLVSRSNIDETENN